MSYNRMQLEKEFVWKKFCIGNRNCMVECMVRTAGIVGSPGGGIWTKMRYNRMQLEKEFVWKKFCIGNRNCMVDCMVRIAGIVGSPGGYMD